MNTVKLRSLLGLLAPLFNLWYTHTYTHTLCICFIFCIVENTNELFLITAEEIEI